MLSRPTLTHNKESVGYRRLTLTSSFPYTLWLLCLPSNPLHSSSHRHSFNNQHIRRCTPVLNPLVLSSCAEIALSISSVGNLLVLLDPFILDSKALLNQGLYRNSLHDILISPLSLQIIIFISCTLYVPLVSFKNIIVVFNHRFLFYYDFRIT